MLEADAGGLQRLAALRGFRVGVAHRRNHPLHLGFFQCVHARRRAAMVAAGLEAHIDSGINYARPGRFQGDYFSVRPAGALVPAFADDFFFPGDDATNARVRRGRV